MVLISSYALLDGVLLCMSVVCLLSVSAQEVKPPTKLVFQTKMGNVTYDHAATSNAPRRLQSVPRQAFPAVGQGSTELQTGHAQDGGSEQNRLCGLPRRGGMAFPTAGNCAKCHVKAAS